MILPTLYDFAYSAFPHTARARLPSPEKCCQEPNPINAYRAVSTGVDLLFFFRTKILTRISDRGKTSQISQNGLTNQTIPLGMVFH